MASLVIAVVVVVVVVIVVVVVAVAVAVAAAAAAAFTQSGGHGSELALFLLGAEVNDVLRVQGLEGRGAGGREAL